MTIFYESHGRSVDNEAGIASGHRDAPLSEAGRRQAEQMGLRYADREIVAVFCSDLRRAYETAEIAFADRGLPIRRDPRLRELDYGEFTGRPRDIVRTEWPRRIKEPFPAGESVGRAVERVGQFLQDLMREDKHGAVIVVDHIAVPVALEHWVHGVPLERAVIENLAGPGKPEWVYLLTDEARWRIERGD